MSNKSHPIYLHVPCAYLMPYIRTRKLYLEPSELVMIYCSLMSLQRASFVGEAPSARSQENDGPVPPYRAQGSRVLASFSSTLCPEGKPKRYGTPAPGIWITAQNNGAV